MKETFKEAAERYYEDNIDESNIPREHYEWEIQDLMIGFAYQWQQEQDKSKYSEEEMLEFSEWVSHNDWVYLPSKGYWVNEEVEESEEKFTTKELFKQFKKK